MNEPTVFDEIFSRLTPDRILRDPRATGEGVAVAIIDSGVELGVPEHKLQQLPRRQQLLRAIEEAYFRDVLVFAAAHNEHPITRSYPAAFAPPLISVDKGLFDDPLRFAYHLREQVEFQAYGKG